MGLFNFKNKNKNKNTKPDIYTIAYDYNGYDIRFVSGSTDPQLYKQINDIITKETFDINSIAEFKILNKDSDEDTFWAFYDSWLEKLRENDYVIHLNNEIGIIEFTKKINKLLKIINETKKLDVNFIANRYKEEINKYSYYNQDIDENFNYDILEANIIAAELRNMGYELINFFNGFDNDDKTIISIDDIKTMKEIEEKLAN